MLIQEKSVCEVQSKQSVSLFRAWAATQTLDLILEACGRWKEVS